MLPLARMPTLDQNSRGPEVQALQRALTKLGWPLVDDGVFGPKTLAAVQGYAGKRTATSAPDWLVAAISGEARTQPVPATAAAKIRSIGAWAGTRALREPGPAVELAVRTKLQRIDIVVNDHSAARSPRKFDTHSVAKIEALAQRARDAGLEVHVTSWLMPHKAYISEAAAQLVPLCSKIGASSLQWDAEEPWTLAQQAMDRREAAAWLHERFTGLSCPMGANAIGFASVEKFGPLAEICDYVVPQAYATNTSKIAPEAAPPRFHDRYAKLFERPIAMGLAAYGQSGIAGHTPASAVRAAIDATAALGDVDTIIFWSLDWLRQSETVARAVAESRG
ncbi:MAG TPA: peptidoglycan-binding domain-containing protein [Nannocystaceae bacterium]|nr:peptidoglycan-binding domain-containing protein [Nannocystaceae bacterium]